MTTVDEVLAKPYRRLLTPDPGGGYTATIHEFPGCVADGATADEAMQRLEEAARSWVLAALDSGYPVREPVEFDDFSGRVALRISRRLHKMAAECAENEGTSVNQLLSNAIAHYLGQRDGLVSAARQVAQACDALQQHRHINLTIYTTTEHLVTTPDLLLTGGVTAGAYFVTPRPQAVEHASLN